MIGLLVSLYVSFKNQQELRQAEATLNNIIEGIGIAESKGSYEMTLVSPKGWIFAYFDSSKFPPPDSCFGEDCLCFCSTAWVLDVGPFGGTVFKKCTGDVVCKVSDAELVEEQSDLEFDIILNKPIDIIINKESTGEISIKRT